MGESALIRRRAPGFSTSGPMKRSELEPARDAASAPSWQGWVKLHRSDSNPAGLVRSISVVRSISEGRPAPPASSSVVGVPAGAEEFVAAKIAIAMDTTAPAGDRLRAMEQLESRALGKPKETVEHQDGKSDADDLLDRMSTEELEALAHQPHLRVGGEQ
jgi:hypothetical protein